MATLFDGMSTEHQILYGCLIAAACLVVIALLGCFIDLAVNRKTRNQDYEPEYDQDILVRQPGYDSMTPGDHTDKVAELPAGPPIIVVTPPEDYDRSEESYPPDETPMARRGHIYDSSYADGSVLRPIRMVDPTMSRVQRKARGGPVRGEVNIYDNNDDWNHFGAYHYSRDPPIMRMVTYGNHNRWHSGAGAEDYEYSYPVPYRSSVQPMRQMAPWQTTMPARYSLPTDIEAQRWNGEMIYMEPYDPIMDDPIQDNPDYLTSYTRPAAGHHMASYYGNDPTTLARGDYPQRAYHVSNVQTNRQTIAPWGSTLDEYRQPLVYHYPYYQPRAEQMAHWQTSYLAVPYSYLNYWQNSAPYLWDQRYRRPVRGHRYDSEGESDSERSRQDEGRHKKSKRKHKSGRSRHRSR